MWLDDRLFELWEAWKRLHAEYVAELRAAVEREMAAAGVTGDPADHVASPRLTIGRIDDGPSSVYYEVVARVELRFGAGRQIAYNVDPDTGETTSS